jgi:transcriptional regulator with GAF, ATPase, and Fis domain
VVGGLVNGRYRLLASLGAGAEGRAWSARDERSGREVALKLVDVGPAARSRLRAEFAHLSTIHHPALLSVDELDEVRDGPLPRGALFYSAELCAPLPSLPPDRREAELLKLLGDVAGALATLHAAGLVHHDVKPENIFIGSDGGYRLGDLGLALAAGLSGGLRGTLAYLAPEALRGGDGPQLDLFALGATALALWSGAPPRPTETRAAIAAIVRPLPQLDGASAGLGGLVAALTALAPEDRPSSAAVVVDECVRLGAPIPRVRAATPRAGHPIFAERDVELAAARARLDEGGLLWIRGHGRSRFIDELRRADQLLSTEPSRWLGPSVRAALVELGLDGGAPADAELRARGQRGRLVAALRNHPARLCLAAGAADADELARLAAHGGLRPAIIIVDAGDASAPAAPSGRWVTDLTLRALSATGATRVIASIAGRLPEDVTEALVAASGGDPRRVVELTRAILRPSSATPTVAMVRQLAAGDISAWVGEAIAALPSAARRLVAGLTALGRTASLDELAAVSELPAAELAAGLKTALAAGVVADGTIGIDFPSRAHRAAAEPADPALIERIAHLVDEQALTVEQRAFDHARVATLLGRDDAAEAAAAVASDAVSSADATTAAELVEQAARAGAPPPVLALLRAGLALRAADYDAVVAHLTPLVDAGEGAATLMLARALQRSGRAPAAADLLTPLTTRTDQLGAVARGLRGRLLVSAGRWDDAAALCTPRPGDGPRPVELDEALGLAELYRGHPDEAARAFAWVVAHAVDNIQRARGQSLAGMAAQAAGNLAAAAAAYRDALDGAREAGDFHGAAVYAANLAAVLREEGELGQALAPSVEAATELERLGKPVERASALFNHGNLLLTLGDLDGAEAAARESSQLAGQGREAAFALLLRGDVERRRNALSTAEATYRDAASRLTAPADQSLALRSLAETLAAADRLSEARRVLRQASEAARIAGQPQLVRIAAARVLLAAGEPVNQAAASSLAADLAADAASAATAGRREVAFRAHIYAGRLRLSLTDANAVADLRAAHALWQEILMRTPELRRPSADQDPDAKKLRALLGAVAPTSDEPAVDQRWRRLAAINKRLNSEQRRDRILELILDTVHDLTGAERCFVLLGGGDRPFDVAAARNIDAAELQRVDSDPSAGPAFSRSIAERAAREGAPIVTFDARGDERFEAALSVTDLKLRSVLAVPLAVKGRSVGCVYADHRLRAGLFDDSDVELCTDLAEQAAIAIENARLLEENAAQREAVAKLNRELEARLATQALELDELHQEVRRDRAALTIRYDYRNIVGRTGRMQELFRLLDRITDTALPVVVYGESGTGKELVARAIHHNGPRRDRPFVSESCGAIPETLLEATLFGHVRGAFTGADQDRRGLFEVAHEGTLFLDEVGEMSAAMQVKLLRVLTTGEFRRVGGERTHKVDVRLVVASNRDLGKMVEEGAFREDLFYRLNVIRVALPPLRERRDDIPLLVEHFLRKHSQVLGTPARRIERAALQRLMAYRWPGNVRELENEILRASALGGEVLRVADLSPHITSGEPGPQLDPDELDLHRRVERLERTLVEEALRRTEGNQSQAARLLGLSRFGLQKMLRRFGMAERRPRR